MDGRMNIVENPNKKELECVISDLKKGHLIVYPTDTIYGIGANIYEKDALKKVYDVKHRDVSKPVSLCLHDINQMEDVAYLTKPIKYIIEKILPGPYTLLLEKMDIVPDILTSNTSIVGVRIPNNRLCYELTKEFPITSTSANISNMETPNNIDDIVKQLGSKINTYIDCGDVTDNTPSTIIDLTGEYPKIIRNTQPHTKLLESILKINLY